MARTAARPVSEANLNAAVSEMVDFYKQQDNHIEHTREVVEFRNTIPLDDDYKTTGYVVRDTTATDHVLSNGMMLTVNRPKLQLEYASQSEEMAKLKAKLEPALEALILDDAGHRGETYQRIGMSLSQDGGAWSSMVADLDAWKGPGGRYSIKRKSYTDDSEYPTSGKSGEQKYVEATDEAKRRSRCVLDWSYRDPKTVYPVWLGERELGAIFVVTEHPKWSTLAEYNLTLDYEGNLVDIAVGQSMPENEPRVVGEKVRKVEHWTAKSVTYFVTTGKSTRRVDGWDHNYGFIPFAWTYGWRLPHWSNIKVGWGSAGVMLHTVEYVSYLKTLHANQAAGSIAPPYKRLVPLGGDPVRDSRGNPVEYTRLKPNHALNLRPGEDLLPVQSAEVNQHLREQIAMEREGLEQLRGPVASGNLNDAQNGFAIESVKADRRVKSNAFISGLQDHLEQVTEMAIKLIRNKIKEAVWVRPTQGESSGWMSLSRADLEHQPLIAWDVSPEQAAGKIVESRHWNERLAAGTAGPDQAIEAQGDNPQDVYEDQMRAKIRQDPLVYQLHLNEVFAEYARGDLLQQYQAAQQVALTGMVQPPQMGGMGAGGIPGDTGALTMAPNGQGATPISPQAAGIAGPTVGMPSYAGGGFSTPGATAQIQDLGT